MSSLRELNELERILELGRNHLDVRIACAVSVKDKRFPVYRISMGNPDQRLPAIGFFGGIHGLERIGTHVLLFFLRGLVARLEWDSSLHHLLQHMRVVFMPLINPGGMWQSTRSNPHGVDLMRNAPVDAEGRVPFLLGGHHFSPLLPWYRGKPGADMEIENQAVCRAVQEELMGRDFSIAIDCHSGFGARDRVWFPYARSLEPIGHLADILRLEELFQQIYPNNRYLFEPQCFQYRTHGDIWDYLYLQSLQDESRMLLPLTLEMESWLWIRKNPRQVLSRHGLFNPAVEHRQHRVLRRHAVLLDFLLRATCSHDNWMVAGPRRARMQERAVERWYKP